MPALLVETAYFLAPIIGGAAAGAIVGFIGYVGPLLTLNLISSKLFGPKIPDAVARLAGISVMRRSAVEYRKIVYGQAATSGPIIYNNTSGTNRQYLWYAVALCDGEINDLVSVYIDGDEIPKADINWAAGVSGAAGAGTGDVSTSVFVGDNSEKAVNISYTLGHPDQVAPAKLLSEFTDWTASHRCRGVAILVVRLLYNENTEKLWQRGVPSNLRAVVQGRKIYDPRLDTTQIIDDTTSPLTYGGGLHRLADDTTWEWSANPALCIADYMINYMGVASAQIDWVSIAKAADDCDVQVVVPPAASPSNYETRFTCNGALSLGQSHKDNLDALLSSCDGRLSYTGGKWKLRASVWEASSVSFDEDDLAGPVDVRGSSPKSERFNAVRGIFVDPDRSYEAVEFPHITNSTYLTRDNSVEIEYDLKLPMTNSATMAQRIGFRLLDQANNQIVVRLTTNLRGAKVSIGDVISLTVAKLSWSAKTFRVIEWERQAAGTFLITAREDASASYDDPIITDYTTGNGASVTVPSEVVPPPTGLSASSVPYAIRLNWSNPATMEFDYIDVYASETSAWSGASRIASVRTDTYSHNIGNGNVRWYWLRARRNNGDVSARIPDSDTSTVTATAGSGTDSINVTGATLSDVQVTATADAGYRLTTGGQEESYDAPASSPVTWDTVSTWLLSGSAANYSCRLTKTSGTDPTGGTLNTWQALSATRLWYWTDTNRDGNAVTFVGTIEIGDNTTSPISVLGSAAIDVTVNAQPETLSLSGSTGTPNMAYDSAPSPDNASAGWNFGSDGVVRKNGQVFAAGVEWVDGTPGETYYIRFTNNSGSNPTSGTLNTWQALTTGRGVSWAETGLGTTSGSVKVEIASGASPHSSDILVTGYYGGSATVYIEGGG